tara:strand:- start:67715 stop:68353 length:639 start_codon:yes stop_codon:yes gene_type:complete
MKMILFKQLIKEKSKYQQTANSKLAKDVGVKGKALLAGTLIAIFLICTPYLFTLYELFPDGPIWETSFGVYTSNYYESVNVVAWTLIGKIIPLMFLFIWFFTCKHWWYHVIIVPICMYSFQIFGVINEDIIFTDVKDIYILAPLILIMAIFSYTIRTRVFDKIHGIDLSELNRVNWKGELANNQEAVKKDTSSTSAIEDLAEDANDSVFMAN